MQLLIPRYLSTVGWDSQVGCVLARAKDIVFWCVQAHTLRHYGAEHPNVAIDLNNLATLLQDTNRLAEAEPLMRRALAIDDQSLGAEHPRVAQNLSILAVLLRDTDRLDEALPLIDRSVADFRHFESQNGFQHPHWDKVLWYYQKMLQAAGLSEIAARMQAE